MNETIERKRLEHKVNGLIFRVSGVFCLLFFIYRLVTFPETLGIGDFFYTAFEAFSVAFFFALALSAFSLASFFAHDHSRNYKNPILRGLIFVIAALFFFAFLAVLLGVAPLFTQMRLGGNLGVCQTCCPPISCGVSDFRGADFGLGVKPDGSGGLPVAGFS
jgi:hypothetical protein